MVKAMTKTSWLRNVTQAVDPWSCKTLHHRGVLDLVHTRVWLVRVLSLFDRFSWVKYVEKYRIFTRI